MSEATAKKFWELGDKVKSSGKKDDWLKFWKHVTDMILAGDELKFPRIVDGAVLFEPAEGGADVKVLIKTDKKSKPADQKQEDKDKAEAVAKLLEKLRQALAKPDNSKEVKKLIHQLQDKLQEKAKT